MMPFQTKLNGTKKIGWEKVSYDGVVVHFGEVGLRKGNRRDFLKALWKNIKLALAEKKVQVKLYWDRLFVKAEPQEVFEVLQAASSVFGVAYAAPVKIVAPDPDVIAQQTVNHYQKVAPKGCSFAVRGKLIDKNFPFSKRKFEALVGEQVIAATDAPVCLDAPEVPLHIHIYEKEAYLLGPRQEGPGGLPVGTVGKGLVLLSGGLDSPVAAWFAMRRGMKVDFLHFHALRNAEEVKESKILKLVEKLIRPQGLQAKLYLVPYDLFQIKLLEACVHPRSELILFRRFMARLAEQVAKTQGYDVLITGDNLGQVASQTMENLLAVEDAVEIPIFRPLLTFDKQEIVDMTRKIGVFELAVQPYKDCCSIIARHPKTRPKLEWVRNMEKRVPTEDLLKQSLEAMQTLVVGQKTEAKAGQA